MQFQVLANIPPKEDLCGMIVDAKVEEECLECFTNAGHISEVSSEPIIRKRSKNSNN